MSAVPIYRGIATDDLSDAYVYAKRLAYLNDASKIRARTLGAFGRAPTVETCQGFVDARRKSYARFSEVQERQQAYRAPADPDKEAAEPAVASLKQREVIVQQPPLVVFDQLPPVTVPLFVSVRWITLAASKIFDVPAPEIIGPCRRRNTMLARQAVYLVAKQLDRWSYPEIGRRLGGRDHSTIIHGARTAGERAKRDPYYAAQINALEAAVTEAFPSRDGGESGE